MKKFLLASIFAVLLLSLSVFAAVAARAPTSFKIDVVLRNPADWTEIKWWNDVTNARGNVWGVKSQGTTLVQAVMKGDSLLPYTLIYYGDATHNDVWPYATCIASGRTNAAGWLSMYGEFNYLPFLTDTVAQKFWIVRSEDVDCKAGIITGWHPNKYLFEKKTV
ncbi:MAG: hypothetical protein V1659_05730 [Candidatus Woesearchaeota archaeon]